MHQDLVLNTFGGVGCKARAVLRIKGVYRFDKSDAADGDQVLLVLCVSVVFSHDVRNKSQIVQDQFFTRLGVTLLFGEKGFSFFSGAKGRGKVLRRTEAEK